VKDQTIPRVLALFALICAVLIAVAALAVRNINRAEVTSDWVNGTHAVINELTGLAATLQAGEGSLRLYAQSGDPHDQAECRQTYGRMTDHLEVVKALTRTEATRHARVLQIETGANARVDFAREVMKLRSEGRTGDLSTRLAADTGSAALSGLLKDIGKLKAETMELLAERDHAAYRQAQTTRWTVWTGVGLNFILLAGAAWVIFRDIRIRREAAATLQQANALLETLVAERTAELSKANDRLSVENLERQWANLALEHQLHYDNLIINSITDLVLVVTKAGNISRLNSAVSLITGWDAADLVNRPLHDFIKISAAPGHLPVADPIDRAMQDGRDLREQPATVRDRQGGNRPVQLTVYPLRDGNKVVGGILTMRTIPGDQPISA
jgi:PAS domain S-box-containing protein